MTDERSELFAEATRARVKVVTSANGVVGCNVQLADFMRQVIRQAIRCHDGACIGILESHDANSGCIYNFYSTIAMEIAVWQRCLSRAADQAQVELNAGSWSFSGDRWTSPLLAM